MHTQAEDSFSDCFYFRQPSYLWHYQQAQLAFSDKIPLEQHTQSTKELKQLFIDDTPNNIMINEVGAQLSTSCGPLWCFFWLVQNADIGL